MPLRYRRYKSSDAAAGRDSNNLRTTSNVNQTLTEICAQPGRFSCNRRFEMIFSSSSGWLGTVHQPEAASIASAGRAHRSCTGNWKRACIAVRRSCRQLLRTGLRKSDSPQRQIASAGKSGSDRCRKDAKKYQKSVRSVAGSAPSQNSAFFIAGVGPDAPVRNDSASTRWLREITQRDRSQRGSASGCAACAYRLRGAEWQFRWSVKPAVIPVHRATLASCVTGEIAPGR